MSDDPWALTPELQKRYNEIVAHTRRLQAELGITPMTLEQRVEEYRRRREEAERREQELKKLEAMTGNRRPPPKWKI